MGSHLPPDDLAKALGAIALAAWVILLAGAVWTVAGETGARTRRRPRTLRLSPQRFGPGTTLLCSLAIALLAGGLTASGRLDALERPVRVVVARLRPPTVPRVLPEASIIDFRCRDMPRELGLWFANAARRAGALAVLLAPPSEEVDPVFGLPPCPHPPAGAPDLPRADAAVRDLIAGGYPALVAFTGEDRPAAASALGQQSPAMGHIMLQDSASRYRLLRTTVKSGGNQEFSAAVFLAAMLTRTPLQEVRSRGADDLWLGKTRVPLLPDGALLVGATPGPLGPYELKVRDPYGFQQHALHTPRISLDSTWDEFCGGRLVLLGVHGCEEDQVSRLAVAYWAANTIVAHLLVKQGHPVQGMHLPHPAGRPTEAALVVLATLLAGAAGAVLRPLRAAAVLAGLVTALGVTTFWGALSLQLILPLGQMLAAIVLCGIATVELSWTFVEARRAQVETSLGRYVSPQVADEVLRNGAPSIGSQRRYVTVMFADIRAFGRIAETETPAALVALVNAYFAVVIDVVFEHGGTLDKFIGDSVMAVWGAPIEHRDDALRAVRAAIDIRLRTAALSEERESMGLQTISLAMGIATGDVVAGNIGAERRMEYTVIGDTVNVAARLQQLASESDADILIEEATMIRVARGVRTEPVGEVTVKHRAQPVVVYSVPTMLPRSSRAPTTTGDASDDPPSALTT